jgi:hypothetical protein
MRNPTIEELVQHPPHYTAGRLYEPIDVILDWKLDYLLGNVLKYISRAGRKSADPREDLKKALFYLSRKLAELEK